MQVQVAHAVVHEPAAVRKIIAEALEIVSEQEITGTLLVPAFEKACDLLGARVSVQMQQTPIGIDMAALRAGTRH